MDDYRKRMLYEYQQLVNRTIRLQNMLTKHRNGRLEFELSCPVELLERQLSVMMEYAEILEERANMEGVKLGFSMEGE